ncbi:MAG: hypothetical protein K2X49_07170 [Acetobacteraceae bacterium]|nr:hypothetical protein [Acetobacteraceae bacterium]
MSGDNLVCLDELRRKAKLAGGGGGGDDGGMPEQRVAALEADMRAVKGILGRIEKKLDQFEAKFDRFDERLRKVEVDVSDMKGRVAQLPTALTLLTGGAGLILATFAFALVRFAVPH